MLTSDVIKMLRWFAIWTFVNGAIGVAALAVGVAVARLLGRKIVAPLPVLIGLALVVGAIATVPGLIERIRTVRKVGD